MSSTNRLLSAAVLVFVGIAALLYSIFVARQLLLGVGVAFALFVVAAFVFYGTSDRRTLARATIIVTLIYGVFTLQLPTAVVAASVVYLTAWVTGPDSPVDAPDTVIFPIGRAADTRTSAHATEAGASDEDTE